VTALEQIGHLSNIPVYVHVELARKIMPLGEILALEEGSVINMTRSAGENIDLFIGGAPVASGEIVIIEETLGVRITDFAEED